MHEAMPEYVHWKYEADKELVKRTAFEWFILRPATLTDDEGTGKGEIGAKVHLGGKIAVSVDLIILSIAKCDI